MKIYLRCTRIWRFICTYMKEIRININNNFQLWNYEFISIFKLNCFIMQKYKLANKEIIKAYISRGEKDKFHCSYLSLQCTESLWKLLKCNNTLSLVTACPQLCIFLLNTDSSMIRISGIYDSIKISFNCNSFCQL